jgi:hypothetical protein
MTLPRCFGENAYYLEDFHSTGRFRPPTIGEFYLSKFGIVFKATSQNETRGGYRLILEPKAARHRVMVESPDAVALPRLYAQPHAEAA